MNEDMHLPLKIYHERRHTHVYAWTNIINEDIGYWRLRLKKRHERRHTHLHLNIYITKESIHLRLKKHYETRRQTHVYTRRSIDNEDMGYSRLRLKKRHERRHTFTPKDMHHERRHTFTHEDIHHERRYTFTHEETLLNRKTYSRLRPKIHHEPRHTFTPEETSWTKTYSR